MNVLVTGGAGFIGSALNRALPADGHVVTVLDDATTPPAAADPATAAPAYIRADVADPGIGALFSAARPEAVLHLAALTSVVESLRAPLRCTTVNVSGDSKRAAVQPRLRRRAVRVRLHFALRRAQLPDRSGAAPAVERHFADDQPRFEALYDPL